MRKLLVGLSLFLGLGTAHAQYQAVITTGTQTIYGTKIFNDYLTANGLFRSYGVAEFGSAGQFMITDSGDISLSQGLTISGGSVTVVDDLKASNFSGNGSALTHITPGNIDSGTAGIDISGKATSVSSGGVDFSTITTAIALKLDLAGGYLTGYVHSTSSMSVDDSLVAGSSLTVGGTDLVTDHTNHRVGIGTASPAYPLDDNGDLGVRGNAYFAPNTPTTSTITATGNLNVPGNITAALVYSTASYAVGAGTAAALGATPNTCGVGQAARGIDANGNAVNCFTPSGSGDVSTTASSTTNHFGTGYGLGFDNGAVLSLSSGTATTVSNFYSSATFSAASSFSFGTGLVSTGSVSCSLNYIQNTSAGILHVKIIGDGGNDYSYSGVTENSAGAVRFGQNTAAYFALAREDLGVAANTQMGGKIDFSCSSGMKNTVITSHLEFYDGTNWNATFASARWGNGSYGCPAYATISTTAGTMTGYIHCWENSQ